MTALCSTPLRLSAVNPEDSESLTTRRSGSIRIESQLTTRRQGTDSTSSWALRENPSPTAAASVIAPKSAPVLHEPWKPGISTRRENRSTVMAWVFIDTSSIPRKKPHSRNANKERSQRSGEPDKGTRDAIAEEGDLHHPPTSYLR